MILMIYVIKSLGEAPATLLQWFDSHVLKSSPDKCYLLLSSNETTTVKVGEHGVENSECEKLLSVN